jgi:hypothetical protein
MASIRWFATISFIGIGLGAILLLIARQTNDGLRPA